MVRFHQGQQNKVMNYKKISIWLLVIGILITIVLSLVNNDTEEYFNQIELPTSNNIVNSLGHVKYCDTILAVGLDAAGISGVTVVINDLTDAAKNQFEGELKAHVRLFNGVYYLFVGALNRDEALRVISHEVVHIQQYQSGELVYENGEVIWQGEVYNLQEQYEDRPWEKEAFAKETSIENIIVSKLY